MNQEQFTLQSNLGHKYQTKQSKTLIIYSELAHKTLLYSANIVPYEERLMNYN